jgi:enoyl-CoA hydratase
MTESANGAVRLEIEGAIARVTFDRPQARNAMTWGMYADLARICDQLAADSTVRCAVFRGAGHEAFVAGTDIEQFLAFKNGEDGVEYEKNIESGIAKMEALPMPTLAVIEGWCVGGGLALATACDIRIATPSSKFGIPIARTLGNCLSIANVARLIAAFGRPRVQRMLLAAELIDADEARSSGFLAQVVDAAQVDEAADQRARQLASLAPVTQAVSKEAIRRLLVDGLPQADDLVRRAYGSEDFREGVTAFTGKRPPGWRGQ